MHEVGELLLIMIGAMNLKNPSHVGGLAYAYCVGNCLIPVCRIGSICAFRMRSFTPCVVFGVIAPPFTAVVVRRTLTPDGSTERNAEVHQWIRKLWWCQGVLSTKRYSPSAYNSLSLPELLFWLLVARGVEDPLRWVLR